MCCVKLKVYDNVSAGAGCVMAIDPYCSHCFTISNNGVIGILFAVLTECSDGDCGLS